MTIYQTPYDPATLQCTGPSVPAGFDSLDMVQLIMGAPLRPVTGRTALYPAEGLAFTDYPLMIDGAVTPTLPCPQVQPETSADNAPNVTAAAG